jgi:hypothetical protein
MIAKFEKKIYRFWLGTVKGFQLEVLHNALRINKLHTYLQHCKPDFSDFFLFMSSDPDAQAVTVTDAEPQEVQRPSVHFGTTPAVVVIDLTKPSKHTKFRNSLKNLLDYPDTSIWVRQYDSTK